MTIFPCLCWAEPNTEVRPYVESGQCSPSKLSEAEAKVDGEAKGLKCIAEPMPDSPLTAAQVKAALNALLKHCAFCRKQFLPLAHNHVYCSYACRNKRKAQARFNLREQRAKQRYWIEFN
jgi:hypothetical protein